MTQNVAMDHAWFGGDPWAVEQSNRLLRFFASQRARYLRFYRLDGTPLPTDNHPATPGLIGMNAAAALAATHPVAEPFVTELWEAPIPDGAYRYYSGMLYLFGLLHASGEFRVYTSGT